MQYTWGAAACWLLLIATLTCAEPATQPAQTQPAPQSVILVVDGSGSMLYLRGLVAIEAKRLIAALPAEDRFNLMTFQKTVKLGFPKPVLGTDDHKASAYAILEHIPAEGEGTGFKAAMTTALSTKPTRIVLFTDGDLGLPNETFDDLAALAAPLKRNNTVLEIVLLHTLRADIPKLDVAKLARFQDAADKSGAQLRTMTDAPQ